MFEEWSNEQKKKALEVLRQIDRDGNSGSFVDVIYDRNYMLRYLSEEDYVVFIKMFEKYINNEPKKIQRFVDKRKQSESYDVDVENINFHKINNSDIKVTKKEFVVDWETPYTILGIVEKDYSKEELLDVVGKKINFIKDHEIDKIKMEEEINKILGAYNELTKTSNKKK